MRLPRPAAAATIAALLVVTCRLSGAAPAQPGFAATEIASQTWGEPSLAIDERTSVIYAVVPVGGYVYVSKNYGKTFTRSAPVATDGDSDVAIDDTGAVFASALVGPHNRITISTSYNQTRTWHHVAELTGSEGCDRQWTAAAGKGRVVTLAVCTSLDVWTSTDSARTFKRSTIYNDAIRPGPVVFAPDGSLWTVFSTSASTLRWAHSTNFGKTWTTGVAAALVMPASSIEDSFLFPVIDADSAGNLYVAYSTGTADQRFGVFLTRSFDRGRSWASPIPLSPRSPNLTAPAPNAIFPWLSAGAKGRIAVAWYQAREPAGVTWLDASPDTDLQQTSWDLMVAESVDATRPSPSFATVAGATNIHAGSICTIGGGCAGPGSVGLLGPSTPFDRRMLDFFETAIDKWGNLYIAYPSDEMLTGALPGSILTADVDIRLARQVAGSRLR